MLEAMARTLGLRQIGRLHAEDSETTLESALGASAAADVIVLSGGVSAGKFDLVPAMLERFGARKVFHKVSQQPGKPLLFAIREIEDGRLQLIFGLPGTPLGSHFGFWRYVRPALRCLMHDPVLAVPAEDTTSAILTAPVENTGDRTLFLPARLRRLDADPLLPKSSSDLITAALADAYLALPPGARYSVGERIEVQT